jgi:acyl-CoA hydrolase
MNKISTLENLLAQFRPGMEIFVAGCTGESQALIQALQKNPNAATGVRFTGVHIPTANRFCYADLTPSTRQRCFFLSTELRAAFARGQVDFLPLPYTAIWRLLEQTRFDWVIFQGRAVADGFSLSAAADFTQAALKQAAKAVCIENPQMPISTAAVIARTQLRHVIAADTPILQYDAGTLSSALAVLGQEIAQAIPNGATLQLGLGKLQKAVLMSLKHHRGLRVHSGMISDPLVDLDLAGALAPWDLRSPPVCTGVALGTDALYQHIQAGAFARFMPVTYTHGAATLSSISGLVSINSMIEVDLTGQVNAEMLDGQQISGGGGMADFVLGARLSWGGTSILATPATANAGKTSRIRAQFDAGTPVTVPRHEVDCIATEFGIARLRGLSIDERAQALIAIADPQFREPLAREWRILRKRY